MRTSWIAAALAAVLTMLVSSDRIMILYASRTDVPVALLLVLVTFSNRSSMGLCAALFLIVSLIAGFRAGEVEWALGRSAKLLLIWLAASQWRLFPGVTRTMFWTAVAAVFLNAGLVVLMLGGVDWAFGEISNDGRMSTMLTMPGLLSRVGLVPMCYFLYRIFAGAVPRPFDLVALASCLLVIWRDGSRTSMLCVLLCWAFVMGCLLWERRSSGFTKMLALSIVFGIVLPGIMWQFLDSDNPMRRFVQFLDESRYEGLAATDSCRADLNATALQMIWEDPLFGQGLGTAKIAVSEHLDGIQVVHNVYLQQCAECGIVGLLAITGVLWGWLPGGLRLLQELPLKPDTFTRAYHYNAVFCLATYGLMKLTHPLSSEWGDWMVFCFSSAVVRGYQSATRQPTLPQARQLARAA